MERKRNMPLVETLDRIENASAKLKKEQACYVRKKDGQCLFCAQGKKSSVTPSDKQIKTIKKEGKGLIVTHNHPKPYDSSITKEDMQVVINNDNAGVRAITKKWTYVAQRPAKGWGISWYEFGNVYDKHYKAIKRKFDKDFNDDKITEAYYVDTLTHAVMEKVAKELKFNYFRFSNTNNNYTKSKK